MWDATVSARRGQLFRINLAFTKPCITDPGFMATSPHIRINSISPLCFMVGGKHGMWSYRGNF